MLIVVSDTAFRRDEADIINAMFDAGLELFHLRKPLAAIAETEQFLKTIKEEHRPKIALHAHHQLARVFGISRLHLTEVGRKNSSEAEWQVLKYGGFRLSASIHDMEEAGRISDCFDYVFLGPVFKSFSKPGYSSDLAERSVVKRPQLELIAIGGIDDRNCTSARKMGYDGVAVLGSVWQNADPLTQFSKIKEAWNSVAL